MKVLLAHPGTQYAPHLAREMALRDCLFRYWTGFAFPKEGWRGKLFESLLPAVRARAGNRMISISGQLLRTQPILDFRSRNAIASSGSEAAFFERNRKFQQAIPISEIRACDAVVGFDTSSWLLAGRARALGRRFILDQSIGHPVAKERTFEQLRARFPEWSGSACEKSGNLLAFERQEHDLADVIVVPSGFVKQTLVEEGVSAEKIRLIPFGTDLGLFAPPESRSGGADGNPVKFLFVGGLTARKGVPVLLTAWKQLGLSDAELWLVGSGEIPSSELAGLPSNVKVLGPKGRQEVSSLMQRSDVFVFPSFFEGLAQVQIEALATGLPVIGTLESGAGDLVKDGHNGLIVPAGNVAALAHAILTLASDHQLRLRMQTAAIGNRDELGWTVYGDRWAALLATI